MSANPTDKPEIIAVVDPDAGQDVADYVARIIAEKGLGWPIVVVSGLDGLEALDIRQTAREAELAGLAGMIEKIEIKAERPPTPRSFPERLRPARDWEQRNRQRPRRKRRH